MSSIETSLFHRYFFFVRIYDKSLNNDEYFPLLYAKIMQIQKVVCGMEWMSKILSGYINRMEKVTILNHIKNHVIMG